MKDHPPRAAAPPTAPSLPPGRSSQKKRPAGKATIRDVAEEAGVSSATVSRVLNGAGTVAPDTAAQVEQAVAALRYQPSRTARALAGSGRRVLAVAVPSFVTPFHNALLKGIRAGLRGFECDLLLRDLGSSDSAAELVDFLDFGCVDGLLAIGTELSRPAEEKLRAWPAPAVVIGSCVEGVDSIFWDDAAGGRTATEHLLRRGHRRIGVIQSHRRDIGFQKERLAGHRMALDAAGLVYDPALTASGRAEKHAGFSEEAGYEAMQILLEKTPPVTGVFALSDVQAMGAWAALREAGRSVPEDVALVGYDDVKTSGVVGLTSTAQNMHEVGERAAEHLLGRLRGSTGAALRERVRPQLQARRSSRTHLRPAGESSDCPSVTTPRREARPASQ